MTCENPEIGLAFYLDSHKSPDFLSVQYQVSLFLALPVLGGNNDGFPKALRISVIKNLILKCPPLSFELM